MNTDNPYYTIFRKQQDNSVKARIRSTQARIEILSRLEKKLHEYRPKIQAALYSDFKKPASQTDLTELYPVLGEIRHAKSNLRAWMRPVLASNGLAFWLTDNKIVRTAKGVCLIISPWNYPLALTFGPLVSAIAAGNTVFIKPSEFTPHISSVMKSIVEELFSEEDVTLIEGDHLTASKLLELPFDHIHFTGSTHIGSKIMESAAKNLTSITLELGGKSPVYVHADADIEDAAIKIVTAKLVNAGQTCIAPDYLLAHNEIVDDLTAAIEKSFRLFYDNSDKSPAKNYTSIVNEKQFNRLIKLIPVEQMQLAKKDTLIIEPLLIKNASTSIPAMQEEIFGPVLPVITVMNADEAIKIIHHQHVPLSIYVFTGDQKIKQLFTSNTVSGSICFNDCAVQFLHPGLPFGGYHHSGIGRSHGKAGFLAMSEERVIFNQRRGFTMAKLLYPPYNQFRKKLIDLLLKYF